MNKSRCAVLVLLLLLCAGCSRATMSLELSLYGADLQSVQTDRDQTRHMRDIDLAVLRSILKSNDVESKTINRIRMRQAQLSLEILRGKCAVRNDLTQKKKDEEAKKPYIPIAEAVIRINCKTYYPPAKGEKQSNIMRMFNAHVRSLRLDYSQIRDDIAAIESMADAYEALLDDPAIDEAELTRQSGILRYSMESLAARVVKFANPRNSEYETKFLNNMDSFIELAKNERYRQSSLYADLKNDLREFATLGKEDDGTSQTKSLLALLREYKKIPDEILRISPTNLQGDRLTTLLRQSNLMTTLLFRLQDPADPLWREVTNEDNEPNWVVLKKKTEASAWGKTDITMVQDTPMLHRVQKIHGDPSQMMASQLLVSRAVGNAAIKIAQSASGINLGGALNLRGGVSTEADAQQEKTNSAVQQGQSVAVSEARLKILKDRYTAAKTRLMLKLETLRTQLANATEDAQTDAVKAKIAGSMAAFRDEFQYLYSQDDQ